jgi:regulator of sigma E protease
MFFPLVIFHELGHFLVAKLARIRVTKFAFGFGKELFRFHFKGTDFRWNLIPLGGYVDLMGEVSVLGEIPDDPDHFYNKPKWVRFLVMVMGPVFNLILAFLMFWVIQYQPRKSLKLQEHPLTVGFVDEKSPEFRAGLRPGDQILSMNDVAIDTYDDYFGEVVLIPHQTAVLDVVHDGTHRTLSYEVSATEKDGVGDIAFIPAVFLRVGKVMPGSPAEKAGIHKDDVIVSGNGSRLYYSWKNNMLSDLINSLKGTPVNLTLRRGSELLEIQVKPELSKEGRFLIGIQMKYDFIASNPTLPESFEQAWNTFLSQSTMIFRAIKGLTSGSLPVKSMTGPIGLGKIAKQQLELGWMSFLGLMAILSLNLGIFNLIPIPVLDGGEIFVLLVESVTRRDFSLNTKVKIKMIGFLLLVSLMSMVLVSDAVKLFT